MLTATSKKVYAPVTTMVDRVKNRVHKPTKSSQLRALDELFITPKPIIPRRNGFGHSVHISGGMSRARHISEASSAASVVTAGSAIPRLSTSTSISKASVSKTFTLPELGNNSAIYVTPWEFQGPPSNYIAPTESEGCSSLYTTSPTSEAAPLIVVTPPEEIHTDTKSDKSPITCLSPAVGSFLAQPSVTNRSIRTMRRVEAAHARADTLQIAEAQAIGQPKVRRKRSAANCGVRFSPQTQAVGAQAVRIHDLGDQAAEASAIRSQVAAGQVVEEDQVGESQATEKSEATHKEMAETKKREWLERTDAVVRGYIRENDQFVRRLVQLRDKSVGNEKFLNSIDEMLNKATLRRQRIALKGERIHKKIERRVAVNEAEKGYENALLRLASCVIAEDQKEEHRQVAKSIRPVSWRP